MVKRFLCLATAIVGFAVASEVVLASESFYEGKAIRIIVGYSAGGGYDTYARVLSRHMGRHIPGNLAIIVENMPGAGSLISANYLYKVAKPDGLAIGHFGGGLLFNQVMGQLGIEFDARKFVYVGAANKEDDVATLSKASGITNIEKWMSSKTPIKLGGFAPGGLTDNAIRILKTALGLPIQLVSGYKGSADIRLAVESGELAGSIWAWDGAKTTWRDALESGNIVAVLQAVPKPLPDLPNVPLAINLARTDEARQLIEVGIHRNSVFSRPFVLPPGTPRERVQTIRLAFQKTLKDKEFLAEAEKIQMGLDPITGDELERTVNEIFKLDPVFLVKLKEILFK